MMGKDKHGMQLCKNFQTPLHQFCLGVLLTRRRANPPPPFAPLLPWVLPPLPGPFISDQSTPQRTPQPACLRCVWLAPLQWQVCPSHCTSGGGCKCRSAQAAVHVCAGGRGGVNDGRTKSNGLSDTYIWWNACVRFVRRTARAMDWNG